MGAGSVVVTTGATTAAMAAEKERREIARRAFQECSTAPKPEACRDAVVFKLCQCAVLDPGCTKRAAAEFTRS